MMDLIDEVNQTKNGEEGNLDSDNTEGSSYHLSDVKKDMISDGFSTFTDNLVTVDADDICNTFVEIGQLNTASQLIDDNRAEERPSDDLLKLIGENAELTGEERHSMLARLTGAMGEINNLIDEAMATNLESILQYYCGECSFGFHDIADLSSHIKLGHKESKPFQCGWCLRLFKTAYLLQRHVQSHNRGRPFKCKECGQQLVNGWSLSRHMLTTHRADKPHKCTDCPEAFFSESGLQNHRSKHTGIFPFTCEVCGKKFACRDYYGHHLKLHDPPDKSCSVCGKMFIRAQGLSQHMKTHTGHKPYECKLCPKKFTQGGHLQRHVRTHTGERPFPCDLCPKRFSQKIGLQKHRLIHTGERDHECPVCDKKFAIQINLQTHMRTHTGERPYECAMCGKTFTQQGALNTHMKTHTGTRNYYCDICGRGYAAMARLEAHKWCHMGKKPFQCTVCNNEFASSESLVKHMSGMHDISQDQYV